MGKSRIILALYIIGMVNNVIPGPLQRNGCSQIFRYVFDGENWIGIITISWIPPSGFMKLTVTMTINAMLPNKYVGKLELDRSHYDYPKPSFSEREIRYKLYFPLKSPLPRVSRIKLNNNVLCAIPAASGWITEIALEHTFSIYPKATSAVIRRPTANSPPDITDESAESRMITNAEATTQLGIEYLPAVKLTTPPESIVYKTHFKDDKCGTRIVPNPLIVNGKEATRGEFPWVTAIYRQTVLGLDYHCGGTLISAKHVITAAHCIQYNDEPAIPAEDLLTILGKFNIKNWKEPGTLIVEVADIYLHPDYKQFGMLYSDIAVLILRFDVTFSHYIRPVCLWMQEPGQDYSGSVVGWGVNRKIVSSEPHQLTMLLVSQEMCLRSKIEFRYLTSNTTYCAGNRDGSGPCNGDSGAGMVVFKNNRFYLRGIVSMSLKDPVTQSCDFAHYSIFTDVDKFKGWLHTILYT